MIKMKKLCWTGALSFLMASHAFAGALDVTAMGGFTAANLNQSAGLAQTTSTGFGYGLAALIGHDFIPILGLGIEAGLMYEQEKVNLNGMSGGQNGSLTYSPLFLPVMIRFMPLDVFAIEAGGYLGLSATANTSVNGVNTNFSTTTDNGLIFGATVMLPILPIITPRLSAYYQQGMTDISGNGSNYKLSSINVMAGVKIGL